MIEGQKLICERLLSNVLEIPCATLFWNSERDLIDDSISSPVSLEYVSQKLSKGVYASASDFLTDLRRLFHNAMSTEKGLRLEAARYLWNKFEEMVEEQSPNMHPNAIVVSELAEQLEEIYKNTVPIKKRPNLGNGIRPGAEVLKNSADDYSVQALRECVGLLESADLICRVALFLMDRQPETVLMDASLSLDFSLMTEQTRKDLRLYLQKLLEDSAVGKI
jgi:hypothetical protein